VSVLVASQPTICIRDAGYRDTIPSQQRVIIKIIIIITRWIIVSEMRKHRHYRRFRERMTEEMGLQMFPENRY